MIRSLLVFCNDCVFAIHFNSIIQDKYSKETDKNVSPHNKLNESAIHIDSQFNHPPIFEWNPTNVRITYSEQLHCSKILNKIECKRLRLFSIIYIENIQECWAATFKKTMNWKGRHLCHPFCSKEPYNALTLFVVKGHTMHNIIFRNQIHNMIRIIINPLSWYDIIAKFMTPLHDSYSAS